MTPAAPIVRVGTAVIGGGPAGMAVLRALADAGGAGAGSGSSVCLVDPSPVSSLGAGSLGRYRITSDTAGQVFVDCCGIEAALLDPCARAEAARLVDRCSTPRPVALADASALLALGARCLLHRVHLDTATVRFAPAGVLRGGGVFLRGGVESIADGGEHKTLRVRTGRGCRAVQADNVVLATGARPWTPTSLEALAADRPGRVVHSDEVIRGVHAPVGGVPEGGILVVGGSHSAFAAANVLFRAPGARRWPAHSVTIAHRSPIRVTYADEQQAIADGARITAADVCPLTGRVHRFSGLRADAATLWRRARDGHEPRLRITPVDGPDAIADLAAGAPLIVSATGYSTRFGAVLGRSGGDHVLSGRGAGELRPRARVDGDGRMLDATGRPRPGWFGIGLGAGVPPIAGGGGEASFRGEVNGVWYYQNVVARAIVARLTA